MDLYVGDASGHDRDDAARPYLGIHFECCGVYVRVYRRRGATRYVARCPRCLRTISFPVGRHGTRARLFRAR